MIEQLIKEINRGKSVNEAINSMLEGEKTYTSFSLDRLGSRRTHENFDSISELKAQLNYYGLPVSLADFSNARYDKENGYAKKSYREWSVYAYPDLDEAKKIKGTGFRINYDDQFVKVYDKSGKEIYSGIEDYEPMKMEPWKFDKDLGAYRLKDFIKVAMED